MRNFKYFLILLGILFYIITWIFLYYKNPHFVQSLRKDKSIRNIGKVFLYSLLLSLPIWLMLFGLQYIEYI
jgi:hypothetical protein